MQNGRLDHYPWSSPGMPPMGPDFQRWARGQGEKVDEHVLAHTHPGQKGRPPKPSKDARPGKHVRRLYNAALREPGFEMNIEIKSGISRPATFIPGHLWGEHADLLRASMTDANVVVPPVTGPQEAEVMVLGKMPWKDELSYLRNLMGASGEVFLEILRDLRFKNLGKWYVTNLLKFVPPDGSKNIKKPWLSDCLPLLTQELWLVKPKYILCLGADASKALLGNQKYGVGYMDGRVVPYTYQVPGEDEPRVAQVMTVLHPAQVAADRTSKRQLQRGLERFRHLTTRSTKFETEDDVDHRVCSTLKHALRILKEAERDLAANAEKERECHCDNVVFFDAEWQGEHPTDPDSYVRTLQMSWADKKAVCFKLTEQGGAPCFVDGEGRPAKQRLYRALLKFMRGKKLAGHYIVNDAEWLVHDGFDISPLMKVPHWMDEPKDPAGREPWQRFRDGEQNFFDTAYVSHALEETAMLGLEHVAMRYTSCPRWETKLDEWKTKYCDDNDIKVSAMDGYGDCPDEVLIGELQPDGVHLRDSYGCYDVDAPRRALKEMLPKLDSDYDGNMVWESAWETMGLALPILEMQATGIKVDRERMHELTDVFLEGRARKELEIQEDVGWKPDYNLAKKLKSKKRKWAKGQKAQLRKFAAGFNVRSNDQIREYLFGVKNNGKIVNGKPEALLPDNENCRATRLDLDPLIDTSKPPKQWRDIVDRGEELHHTASTNKQVMGILVQELVAANDKDLATKVNRLREYRYLDTVLKQVLRPPELDEKGNYRISDDDGNFIYGKGLPACLDRYDVVRTHLTPTADTSRWKSFRPPMQNVPKNRDKDYETILGKENYKNKLRSMFVARKGKVLLEFDYKGAELFGAAVLSGSKLLLEHVRRNNLPDGDTPGVPKHPEYFDIHSFVARLAFKLDCEPTKQGLKDAGAAHLRVVAKAVIFGLFYGRQAKAIAFSAKEQGVNITVEEAQKVIDAIYELYPELVPFFAECRELSTQRGWIVNPFGRHRRFPKAFDHRGEGDIERQAMNFPIQSLVASALNRGVANLYWAIRKVGLQDHVKLILAIHDAVLIECSPEYVDYLANPETGLVRWAMAKKVPVTPTDLSGNPKLVDGKKVKHYLSMSHEVGVRWSVPLKPKEADELGIDAMYAHAA